MNKVATFEKVSCAQFAKDIIEEWNISVEEIKAYYDSVQLPTRATKGSAGYDFRSPFTLDLYPGGTVLIHTGIRVKIDAGWWLAILPRSGIGFKYSVGLCNTVGVIDEDYYDSNNEGHIMIKLINHGERTLHINAGESFAQGIFIHYGITYTDSEDEHLVRNGGFGSTGA